MTEELAQLKVTNRESFSEFIELLRLDLSLQSGQLGESQFERFLKCDGQFFRRYTRRIRQCQTQSRCR
jgi:thiaminase